MNLFLSPILAQAQVGQPLFGNQWLALLAMMAIVAVFVIAVAGLGRWLAATHPDPVKKPSAATVQPEVPLATSDQLTPQVCAAIAAAVAVTYGSRARIAAVQTAHFPSVETLMQQWSLEGRRQIYSSHKVR